MGVENNWIASSDFLSDTVFLIHFSYDALHGVAGAYANRIFVEELSADESSLINCTPKVICF